MIQIYDSYSKKYKEVNSKSINMYVCGITTSDYCHLGHAFSSVSFEILDRFLYSQGFEGEDLIGFELSLTPPSIIYDQQKVALMNEKIQLAVAMKDSKLVSDKYIYEYIFNMSEDEWLEERNNIVEDLKLRFRQNQIEQEGNDPTLTGLSYGTPHDLASMHMSSDDVMDKDRGGRPPEGINMGNIKIIWDGIRQAQKQ